VTEDSATCLAGSAANGKHFGHWHSSSEGIAKKSMEMWVKNKTKIFQGLLSEGKTWLGPRHYMHT
jgi:hypothetical protein